MNAYMRLVLVACLLLVSACGGKKYQGDNQDMQPNLDPELSDNFLKIKRPRPLTEQEKKALASKTDIPFKLDVKENEEVQMFLTYFTQERRETMERWLERAAPHLPYIRAVLSTYKLPPDIIVLPFIESGYNTMAYSPVGAGGMWQFMPATGRRFNLNLDWWEDERRNPYLATVAAAKYLSELYAMFGDWNLALAAYNCGEGKMSRVINQSGQNNFFDIAKNPNLLKQETRHYVPKFLAVLKIFQNLETLGFKPVNWGAGQVMEEIPVPGGTDLAALAEACGMSWDEFHRFNSGFRRQVSPPERQSPVYVPVDKKQLALNYLANPACYAARGIRAYSAAPADTWWNVSKRTGVPIAALRQMNPSAGETLDPGLTLYVPLDSSAQDTAFADLDDRPPPRTVEARSHKIKKGETLASVARTYGVSQADLLRANGMGSAKQAVVGRTLNIPAKAPASCPPVQAAKASPVEPRSVELKKGLTLAEVAKTNKVDLKTLMAANNLKSEKDARSGMKLVIPMSLAAIPAPAPVSAPAPAKQAEAAKTQAQAPAQAQPQAAAKAQASKQPEPAKAAAPAPAAKDARKSPQVHSVANGETVWSIARKFNVDPNALLAWNNLDRSAHLKPGDKLKINVQ